MREIFVGKNEYGQRMDKFLQKYLPSAGKSFIYKMLRKKNIVLNDKKAEGNEILAENDVIKLWMSDETIEKFRTAACSGDRENGAVSQKVTAVCRPLDKARIIYENEDILIYDKPAGLLSQKAGADDVSAVEMLTEYMLQEGCISPEELKTFHPSFCNRLDRNTSGIIAAGKSLKGLQMLSDAFRERTVHKDYLAVTEGEIREGKLLEGYLEKDGNANRVSIGDNGDYIKTEYKPVYTDGNRTLLMVRLHTGKTHQIRAHLAAEGHPVTGDRKYGSHQEHFRGRDSDIHTSGRRHNETESVGAHRHLLHAYRLTMPDGTQHTSEVPEDIKKAVRGYTWGLGKPEAFEDLPSRI